VQKDINKILIDRDQIASRIEEVAALLTGRLGSSVLPSGRTEVTLVPILTGSLVFLADLIRQLPLHLRIRVMSISSYPGQSVESVGASLRGELSDLPPDLSDTPVVILDDILDTGRTLTLARELIAQRNPLDLITCVLLRKQRPEAQAAAVDYVCFDIPDEFVVGYGLDFDGYYRNLPEIATLKPHIIEGRARRAEDD